MSEPETEELLDPVELAGMVLGPLLVMGMAGSLLVFLQLLGYHGEFQFRALWITGCFVVAMVLIARIGIESGPERAVGFGMALAGVTLLAILRLVSPPWPAMLILGVIWWFTHQLTWDATHVDEEADIAGDGLLKVSGLEQVIASLDAPAAATEAETKEPPHSKSSASAVEIPQSAPRKQRPPGLWIMYYSLAALPIFGVGQALLGNENSVRGAAARAMFLYLASGFGLLVVSSLLGLKRYLRKRGTQLPSTLAIQWVGLGGLLTLLALTISFLVPRPGGVWQTAWARGYALLSPNREANPQSFTPGEGAPDPQQQAGNHATAGNQQKPGAAEPDPSGQGGSGDQQSGSTATDQAGQKSGSGQSSGESGKQGQGQGQEAGQSEGQNSTGEPSQSPGQSPAQPARQTQDQNRARQPGQQEEPKQRQRPASGASSSESKGEQAGQSNAPSAGSAPMENPLEQAMRQAGSLLSGVAGWLKWLVGIVLLVVLLVWFWRPLVLLVQGVWQELLRLWRSLWGEPEPPAPPAATEAVVPPPGFADYENPFRSGLATRWSDAELTAWSYAALKAWGRERGLDCRDELTPAEIAACFRKQPDALAQGALLLCEYVSGLSYARGELPSSARQGLARVWQLLEESA